MTCIVDTFSNRTLSAKLATGLALAAFLMLGTFVASASAAEHRDDHRGGEHRDDRGRGGGWGGGYPAPPVIYGAPVYAPPVIFSPAIVIQ
jgi:hypothetical protein